MSPFLRWLKSRTLFELIESNFDSMKFEWNELSEIRRLGRFLELSLTFFFIGNNFFFIHIFNGHIQGCPGNKELKAMHVFIRQKLVIFRT